MTIRRSRGRVAAAVVAALLAGVLLAWLTRPSAAAHPPAAADRVPTTVTTPAPDGPVPDPAGPSGRRTASAPDGTGSPAAPPAAPPAASGATSGQRPAVAATPPSTPTSAAVVAPAPTRLEIPRLKVGMTIQPVGVASDGEMALPGDPADLGWYAYGSRPGDAAGATVLAAHLDYPGYGRGPLAAAEELRPGDTLSVRSGSTVRRYAVTAVRHVAKKSLDLEALFARDGPARIHLVTCGGDFDRSTRSYDENVVVVATPVA
ncbi:MAG: class F sortase [Terracoccus sp.]